MPPFHALAARHRFPTDIQNSLEPNRRYRVCGRLETQSEEATMRVPYSHPGGPNALR